MSKSVWETSQLLIDSALRRYLRALSDISPFMHIQVFFARNYYTRAVRHPRKSVATFQSVRRWFALDLDTRPPLTVFLPFAGSLERDKKSDRLARQAILDEKMKKFLAVRFSPSFSAFVGVVLHGGVHAAFAQILYALLFEMRISGMTRILKIFFKR